MNFAATLVNDENRGVFVTPLSREAKKDSDFFIGLYEADSDTACGVMAVAAVTDEGGEGTALSVREIIIDDAYNCPDAEKELIRALQDMAGAGEFGAIFLSELVLEDDRENRSELYENLGFYQESKKLPLYEFCLSDVNVKEPVTGMGCLNLLELSKKQWNTFASEASLYSFEVMDRDFYDQETSVFLIDDDGNTQAGLLTGIRDGALFIEGIAAYGSDEGALINDLAYWTLSAAKKSFSKDDNIYIYMFSNRTYHDLLQEYTLGKAKKIGNLVNFTYEVPVGMG